MKIEPIATLQGVDHQFDHCLILLAKSKSYYEKYGKGTISKRQFEKQWLALKALYLELERVHIAEDDASAAALYNDFYVQAVILISSIGLNR